MFPFGREAWTEDATAMEGIGHNAIEPLYERAG